MTIPDLCHQHLLGAPCMTLLLWVGPLGAMLSLVRHLGMVVDPRRAEQTELLQQLKARCFQPCSRHLKLMYFYLLLD